VRVECLLDPFRQGVLHLSRFGNADTTRYGVLLELPTCLLFVFLPIADIDPFFLQRLPHPEAPECGKLGIGEQIGRGQE